MAPDHFNDGSYGGRDMKSIVLRPFTGRLFMVFASLVIMSVGGSAYMFGLYSDVIKTSLGYDQTTLNLLSFSKDLGTYVGIMAGLINEVTPTRVVLLTGTLMNFFGYLLIWLAITGRIDKPHYWTMCVYLFIAANSLTFYESAVTVGCVRNFPESRGIVIGLLKAYMGLSGAILTQLYHAVYGDDTKSIILLIAWLPSAVFLVFLPAVRVFKTVRQKSEVTTVFYRIFFMSLALAGFLMILSIVQSKVSFNRVEFVASASVVIFSLFLPLGIVVREDLKIWRRRNREPFDDFPQTNSTVTSNSVPDAELAPQTTTVNQKHVGCMQNILTPPARGEDYTILQALFSIDMAVILIATICSLGGTLAAIDNLAQIGNSLDYPNGSISTFVSLVSIWNYLGRAVSGFVSDYLLKKHNMPRPLLYSLIILLSSAGHIFIAFAVPNSLYFVSVIVGFCFGMQWPLMDVIIYEIFGLKYYSTLRSFGFLASPIGSYILKVWVAGRLYDKEALKQMKDLGLTRKSDKDLTCTGKQCYRMAFIIILATTLFGFFVSCILAFRTWRFYRSDIYKKFKDAETKMASTSEKVESQGTITTITTSSTK